MVKRLTGGITHVEAACPVCGMVQEIAVAENHGQRRCDACENIIHVEAEVEGYED